MTITETRDLRRRLAVAALQGLAAHHGANDNQLSDRDMGRAAAMMAEETLRQITLREAKD